ncbi:MAG: AAA family ATPase [Oligosphaeraceae bacterium]|nr:AAA family ATPase [Oligosphaeraceae bacterium]
MKINRLTFANLASLAGTISIDFTAPEFQENGLFLLSGPTGAGKSTVLDAIALALYGRTPRLSSGREIGTLLSHGQTEYFSELEFNLGERLFQANWRCSRAHNRVDGSLQPPKHMLLEFSAKNGQFEFLADKGEVAKTIAVLSGLNFERFTRTMLLAQGRFADFLQAKEADKSDLLEQITGTEIYSQISQKIYALAQEKSALCREKENLLQTLQINLGTEAEQQQLRLRQQELLATLSQLSQEQKTLQLQQQHCETAAKAARELADLEREMQDLAEEERRFQPKAQRLQRGRSAERLQQDCFTRLQEQRRNLIALEKQSRETGLALPKLRSDRDAKAELQQKSDAALQQRKQEFAALQAVLKLVRPLDAELQLLRRNSQTAEAENQQATRALAEAQRDWDKNQRQQHRAREEKARATAWQEQHQLDGELMTALPELQKLLQDWQEASRNFQSAQDRHEKAAKRHQSSSQSVLEALKLLQAAEMRQQQSEVLCQQQQSAYQQLLNGQSEDDWNNREIALSRQLNSAVEGLKAVIALRQADASCGNARTEQAGLAEKLRQANEILSLWQQKYEVQQERLTLARDIHNYAAMRTKLVSGKPCPLCGSTEHPWDKLPQLEVSEQERALQSLQLELQKAHQEQQRLLAQHGAAAGKYSHAQASLTACQNDWQEACQVLAELLALSPDRFQDTAEVERLLTVKVTELKDSQQQAQRQRAQMQTARQRLQAAEKECQSARQEFSRHEAEWQKYTALAESDQQHLTEAEENLAAARSREQAGQENFCRRAGSYQEECSGIDQAGQCFARLEQRLQDWKRIETALTRALNAEESLLATQAALTASLQTAKERSEQASKTFQEAAALTRDKAAKRQELFAARDCDQEESAANAALEQALVCSQEAAAQLAQAEEKIATSQALLEDQLRQQASWAEIVGQGNAAAAQALQQEGFASEDEFLCACLSSAERSKLQAEKELLDQKVASCRNSYDKAVIQHRDCQQLCQGLDAQAISARLQALSAETGTLNQELGSASRQEKLWQAAQQQYHDLGTELQRLKQDEGQWQELNLLIGSSEGGKFRNIAQSITLDNVIARANERLKIIMPRYELVRAETEESENNTRRNTPRCLAINVIDDYLDGQERDTKNISGGETFVVSLALALGLSGLDNTNLQVETLFLDEGFGSLDASALEQALQALGRLRDDGRLIGIISHVEAMKDLEPQIVVERLGNTGRSRIYGPGCTFQPPLAREKKGPRKRSRSSSSGPIAEE